MGQKGRALVMFGGSLTYIAERKIQKGQLLGAWKNLGVDEPIDEYKEILIDNASDIWDFSDSLSLALEENIDAVSAPQVETTLIDGGEMILEKSEVSGKLGWFAFFKAEFSILQGKDFYRVLDTTIYGRAGGMLVSDYARLFSGRLFLASDDWSLVFGDRDVRAAPTHEVVLRYDDYFGSSVETWDYNPLLTN